jgi:hypothetical protein
MRTRLTLPMRFASERRALNLIRDNGLFTVGALAIDTDGPNGWRVVIDTSKPDVVCRYLAQSMMPGIEWARSDLP